MVCFCQVDGEEYWSSSADVTEIRRRQQLTTDEVVQSTEEVRHTFIIKTVYDPRTGDNISLTEAVYAGIIDQAAGNFLTLVVSNLILFVVRPERANILLAELFPNIGAK